MTAMRALAFLAALAVVAAACRGSSVALTPANQTASASAVGSAATVPTPAGAGGSVLAGPTPTATRFPSQPARILATIQVPGNPNGMLDAYGSVWVSGRHTNAVYRINPASNTITATIDVGGEPSYFADDGQAVWVVQSGKNAMARIDPRTNAVTWVVLGPATYDSPTPVVGAGAVWNGTEAPSVAKVDVRSQQVLGTIDLPGPGATVESEPEVAFAGGLVWIARRTGSAGIQRFDPTTLALRDTVLPGHPVLLFALGSDGDVVWAQEAASILELDATTGRIIAQLPMPTDFDGVNLSGGRLWLSRSYPVAFSLMDPKTGRPGVAFALPGQATEGLWFLDRGPHDLWVSDWDANAVYRVDPTP